MVMVISLIVIFFMLPLVVLFIIVLPFAAISMTISERLKKWYFSVVVWIILLTLPIFLWNLMRQQLCEKKQRTGVLGGVCVVWRGMLFFYGSLTS